MSSSPLAVWERVHSTGDANSVESFHQETQVHIISGSGLCLLGGAYGLAGRLVELLGEVEIIVELLVDADRLVRLLESPAFVHVMTARVKLSA